MIPPMAFMYSVMYSFKLDEACGVYTKHATSGMPWETPVAEIEKAFSAGFEAGVKAATDSDVPLVTPLASTTSGAAAISSSSATTGVLGEAGVFWADAITVPPDAEIIPLKAKGPTTVECEAIYKVYPRHVGRTAALKAIAKAIKATSYESVMDATTAYRAATATWPAADKKFIPHPATWFNRGSYADDRSEWTRGFRAVPSAFSKPAH